MTSVWILVLMLGDPLGHTFQVQQEFDSRYGTMGGAHASCERAIQLTFNTYTRARLQCWELRRKVT